MTIRRTRIAAAATAGLAALGIGLTTAHAQDCIVVNRSIQGAYGAAHSSEFALFDVNAFLGSLGVCQAAINDADAALAAQGYSPVVVTRADKTLPDNGHGIRHFDDPGGYEDIVMTTVNNDMAAGVCG